MASAAAWFADQLLPVWYESRVFAAVLASMLAFAPPDVAPAPGETSPPAMSVEPEPAPVEIAPVEPSRSAGTLVLAPREPGEYQLFDGDGRQIGSPMRLGAGNQPELQLPAGIYYMHGPAGIVPVVVGSGLELVWDGQRVLPIDIWQAELERQRALDEARVQAAAAALEHEPPAPRSSWRAWASPLGSALVPGLGQFMNGQGGKGTGLLFGTLGSVIGAAALYNLGNPPASSFGGDTRPTGAEYARLVGFGVLSTSAVLLWIYGIADAHRVGADKTVEPEREHRLRISATRMMTVGFRADAQRPGFFDDWSVAIMGQATRRLTVGVSDLSVKPGGVDGPQVWQFGARVDYRVFDRKRVWIDLALGSIFQVAVGQRPASLDAGASSPSTVARFGAVPYGQLDVRVFVLDRLSIDLVPRLAVPLTTRYYSVHRALPRFAPELELGAGISTYF
jgi:hypothetical protein